MHQKFLKKYKNFKKNKRFYKNRRWKNKPAGIKFLACFDIVSTSKFEKLDDFKKFKEKKLIDVCYKKEKNNYWNR